VKPIWGQLRGGELVSRRPPRQSPVTSHDESTRSGERLSPMLFVAFAESCFNKKLIQFAGPKRRKRPSRMVKREY
jgi:hypothetical protein